MKTYWKTAAIGDFIPPLMKSSLSRVEIARFSAASKDYNPLNLDDEFARINGYGGVFAQGNLTLSVIEEALYNYAENGRLVRLLGTFHKMVWPGDLLTAKALVSDKYKHNDEPRIDLEVWIENQYHDVVIKGQATYLLWENPKEELLHNGGLPEYSRASIKDITQMIRSKLASLSFKDMPKAVPIEEIGQPEQKKSTPRRSTPKRKTSR